MSLFDIDEWASFDVDECHTNQERLQKIQCLINSIRNIDDELSRTVQHNQMLSHQLANLDVLVDEAERCLEALRLEVR